MKQNVGFGEKQGISGNFEYPRSQNASYLIFETTKYFDTEINLHYL